MQVEGIQVADVTFHPIRPNPESTAERTERMAQNTSGKRGVAVKKLCGDRVVCISGTWDRAARGPGRGETDFSSWSGTASISNLRSEDCWRCVVNTSQPNNTTWRHQGRENDPLADVVSVTRISQTTPRLQ